MLRKRLAALAALAGLGLCVGCTSTRSTTTSSSRGGFFSRLCGRTRTVEMVPTVEAGSLAVEEGPALCDPGAMGAMGVPHSGIMPPMGEFPSTGVMPPMGAFPSTGVMPPATNFPATPCAPAPSAGVPFTPSPRLVPQAQPMPFTP